MPQDDNGLPVPAKGGVGPAFELLAGHLKDKKKRGGVETEGTPHTEVTAAGNRTALRKRAR